MKTKRIISFKILIRRPISIPQSLWFKHEQLRCKFTYYYFAELLLSESGNVRSILIYINNIII